jgi:hypothetical protein
MIQPFVSVFIKDNKNRMNLSVASRKSTHLILSSHSCCNALPHEDKRGVNANPKQKTFPERIP